MSSPNMSEIQNAAKQRDALCESMRTLGGFAVLGLAATGLIASIGEVVDQVVSNGENFPGGTLGKVVGGLAVTAAALIGGAEYFDR